MNQVSELIIAKNSLVSISSTDSGDFQNQSFHEQIEYLERITTNLHESVMKVRMVPIESVVAKFPRMIRDLSRKLDKKMELYMTGEDTELDRTVVDQIGDPLQHLLRNSADHGLEDNATFSSTHFRKATMSSSRLAMTVTESTWRLCATRQSSAVSSLRSRLRQ